MRCCCCASTFLHARVLGARDVCVCGVPRLLPLLLLLHATCMQTRTPPMYAHTRLQIGLVVVESGGAMTNVSLYVGSNTKSVTSNPRLLVRSGGSAQARAFAHHLCAVWCAVASPGRTQTWATCDLAERPPSRPSTRSLDAPPHRVGWTFRKPRVARSRCPRPLWVSTLSCTGATQGRARSTFRPWRCSPQVSHCMAASQPAHQRPAAMSVCVVLAAAQ